MKQGKVVNRVIMLAFLAAILIYLVATVVQSVTDPYTLVQCYSVTVDTSQEVTGLLVREEQVIQGQSGSSAELLYSEGEKVAKGAAVAVLYQSGDAASRSARITALEQEITQLQYALNATGAVSDNAQLSRQIIEAITQLKASTSNGDFTRLEDETLELRGLIYQRADAYGEDSGGVEALQGRLDSAKAELSALQSQASQDTRRITVSQSGIFSGVVDGWESVITPAMLTTLMPQQLAALEAQSPTVDDTAVGKLIADDTWYFACRVSEETAQPLYEGQTVTVRFSRDWAGEVEMKVSRISDAQGGEVAVVLASTRFLSDTTLLRHQTVELMLGSQSGIRVPAKAIRVRSEEVTDEDTGQTVTQNVTGVYALVGTQAEFKPVEILQQADGYCVVANVGDGKKILRSGDQIILAAAEIYDGMVIE